MVFPSVRYSRVLIGMPEFDPRPSGKYLLHLPDNPIVLYISR